MTPRLVVVVVVVVVAVVVGIAVVLARRLPSSRPRARTSRVPTPRHDESRPIFPQTTSRHPPRVPTGTKWITARYGAVVRGVRRLSTPIEDSRGQIATPHRASLSLRSLGSLRRVVARKRRPCARVSIDIIASPASSRADARARRTRRVLPRARANGSRDGRAVDAGSMVTHRAEGRVDRGGRRARR